MDDIYSTNETVSAKQLLRMLKEMRMLSRKAQQREREGIAQWAEYLKRMSAVVDGEIDKVKLCFAAIKAKSSLGG